MINVLSYTFVDFIKQIVKSYLDSSRPVNVLFGTVLSEEPDISVQIDQKKVLTKDFLVLSRNVTDHNVEMTVDHLTEDADPQNTSMESGGAGDAAFAAHKHTHSHIHPYKGRKRFLVHRKLLVGEKVILVSLQGGQQYVILDRVGSDITS